MRLAIIGLSGAGKTTVFNALTGENLPTGMFAGAGRPEVREATVEVPDPRLEALRTHFHPQKTTYAKVIYSDVGGIGAGAGGAGLPGSLANHLAQMDGLLYVLRVFDNPNVPHPASSVDPARDLADLEAEFLLHDMLAVERRLEQLRGDWGKHGSATRAEIEGQTALFERLLKELEQERPLRSAGLTDEEMRLAIGLGLLSSRPALAIANLAESQGMPELEQKAGGVRALPLYGKLEMEIAQLPAGEQEIFRKEYGIEESVRQRVIRASYDLLGMKTFFTMNEKELRAWAVDKRATALEAAGTIHSDLARGFIRAEVIPWGQLLELGGISEARSAGKLRLEGKQYAVADGDVIQIRFNI